MALRSRNSKCLTTTQHPDRDHQFQRISALRPACAGCPVISDDTKKTALVGLFPYTGATSVLILADCGSSNGCRQCAWKRALYPVLCNSYGLLVRVAHYPGGCSKWKLIEHRPSRFPSRNWKGKPPDSFETGLNCIRTTTTRPGLKVTAHRITRHYARVAAAVTHRWPRWICILTPTGRVGTTRSGPTRQTAPCHRPRSDPVSLPPSPHDQNPPSDDQRACGPLSATIQVSTSNKESDFALSTDVLSLAPGDCVSGAGAESPNTCTSAATLMRSGTQSETEGTVSSGESATFNEGAGPRCTRQRLGVVHCSLTGGLARISPSCRSRRMCIGTMVPSLLQIHSQLLWVTISWPVEVGLATSATPGSLIPTASHRSSPAVLSTAGGVRNSDRTQTACNLGPAQCRDYDDWKEKEATSNGQNRF